MSLVSLETPAVFASRVSRVSRITGVTGITRVAFAVLAVVTASVAGAQGSEQMRPPAADVPGTRDAAALPRYRGATLLESSSV